MMMRLGKSLAAVAIVCGAALVAAAADSADAPFGLRPGGHATVTEVVDGDTVLLSDGREVRLVGIQAPKLPLGRRNFPTWPLAEEAKAALERLTLGHEVTLGHGGRDIDRHGRQLAHLFLDGGQGDGQGDRRWVQETLLGRGLARVYSFADNRALVAEMLSAERTARTARRGIWARPYYAIRTPAETGRDLGSFQLVEGRVLDVAQVRGTTYLNFGADWRTDFTVTVRKRNLASFVDGGFDLEALEGRRVRVRGWLDNRNGPMIEATHPEQIEVLED